MISWQASAPHYADHLAPIWHAMPEAERGEFVVPDPLADHARSRGIEPVLGDRTKTELVVVASFLDLTRLQPGQRAVLVEHGAAQRYMGDGTATGDHGGWPGGPGREQVALFVVPSERAAAANRERYPDTPAAVVGCPKIDRWMGMNVPRPQRPVVALSWRWDSRLVPETHSAWPYYARFLRNLTGQDWDLLGHAHPRCPHEVWALYDALGIETTRDFDDVMARASVFVADNTSCLFEFAATGRPVVALNMPAYRRDVNHGLRFWDAVPGIECDDPADLPKTIATALSDPPGLRDQREAAVAYAYAYIDGQSSRRAAGAILEVAHA